jgi:hypothetical protein
VGGGEGGGGGVRWWTLVPPVAAVAAGGDRWQRVGVVDVLLRLGTDRPGEIIRKGARRVY